MFVYHLLTKIRLKQNYPYAGLYLQLIFLIETIKLLQICILQKYYFYNSSEIKIRRKIVSRLSANFKCHKILSYLFIYLFIYLS